MPTALANSDQDERCPSCQKLQRTGWLRKYSITLDDSVVVCDNDQCCYPLDIGADERLSGSQASDVLGKPAKEHLQSIELDKFHHAPSASERDSVQATVREHSDCQRVVFDVESSNSCSYVVNGPTTQNANTVQLFLTNECDGPVISTPCSQYVMLWANTDALCWLDVLLCALCYCQAARQLVKLISFTSVIHRLFTAFDEAKTLIEPLQNGHDGILHSIAMKREKISVKRGGGYTVEDAFAWSEVVSPRRPSLSKDTSLAQRKLHLAALKLDCAREEVWHAIVTDLRCTRGDDDSPVFAFPVLLKLEPSLHSLYEVHYKWLLSCSNCGHQETSEHSNVMPTFAHVTSDFSLPDRMHYTRNCFKCGSADNRRRMVMTRLHGALAIHFAEGLQHNRMDLLTFTNGDSLYQVTAVVVYTTSPNHFTLWQRDVSSGHWMLYDDLASRYSQFNQVSFDVIPQNIHIVFWEKIVQFPAGSSNSVSISTDAAASQSSQCIPSASPSAEVIPCQLQTSSPSSKQEYLPDHGFIPVMDEPSYNSMALVSTTATVVAQPQRPARHAKQHVKVSQAIKAVNNTFVATASGGNDSSTKNVVTAAPSSRQSSRLQKRLLLSSVPTEHSSKGAVSHTAPATPVVNTSLLGNQHMNTATTSSTKTNSASCPAPAQPVQHSTVVQQPYHDVPMASKQPVTKVDNSVITSLSRPVADLVSMPPPKKVMLLSKKLGSKPTVVPTQPTVCPPAVESTFISSSLNTQSYESIMTQITTSSSHPSRSRVIISARPAQLPGKTEKPKSYLEKVKPLLEKSKLAKAKRELVGYVPKLNSQDNDNGAQGEQSVRKKVMFRGESPSQQPIAPAWSASQNGSLPIKEGKRRLRSHKEPSGPSEQTVVSSDHRPSQCGKQACLPSQASHPVEPGAIQVEDKLDEVPDFTSTSSRSGVDDPLVTEDACSVLDMPSIEAILGEFFI